MTAYTQRSLFALCALAAAGCSSSNSNGSPPKSADAGRPSDASVRSDSGHAPDGSSALDASGASEPFDQWTWLDVPDSKCASGAASGFAINPHRGATTLLLYLEGGGECFDAATCWGPNPSATHLTGYDSADFASAMQRNYPIFDRTRAMNPLRDANMVFVPYCTGDLHSGTTQRDLQVAGSPKPTYFWGANNLDSYLAQLVTRFAGITHVFMVGTSAGGFGTVLNFARVVNAFHAPTDIIDDSGPPITAKGASTTPLLKVWGYVPPADCSTCTSHPEVLHYDRTLQPQSRFAFLSFAEDTVISMRLGYTLDEYPMVMDMFSASLAGDPNAATFIVTNEAAHVVESDPALAPQYMPWLQAMVNGDSGFKDATYAKP